MGLKTWVKARLVHSKSPLVSGIFKPLYRAFLKSGTVQFLRYKGWMSDRKYIEYRYQKAFGKKPDLDAPKTFNEKNNWRKLNDRNPLYTRMVDKAAFKDFVRERCGEGYTVPLLASWDDPKKIKLEDLPDQFVLKATHAGGVIVCRDKTHFNLKEAIKDLSCDLKSDYFIRSREWPYKNVPRRVIAEKYMGENISDYKNYCFNGELKYTFVWKNVSRADGRKPDPFYCGGYDRAWQSIGLALDYPSLDEPAEKPACYAEMVEIAEKIAKDIPFVRVDFYIIDGRPYVGEATFFPWGGFLKITDKEWNARLGEMEKLPYEKGDL